MEGGNKGLELTPDAQAIIPIGDDKNVPIVNGAKKKRGGISLLRAAMHMLHRRPSGKKLKKPIYAEVASAEVLNKVVGSMRPLHAQGDESPPNSAAPVIVMSSFHSPTEQFEDVPQSPASVIVPPSPDHSSTTSEGGTSRYASALNLQELDAAGDEENENKEGGEDNRGGDEMIDLKADEFIARFYQQMRIQNQNERDRLREMQRSQPYHVGDE
ncbi:hypothetical protein MLD38_026360 [Melastoma candidum]|uniref:Uncharacterized protein n=1 Tax=Melastoma candidum TaxID=119954 RepID=A0ACB9P074_9MYRT|nr:hypothetical protein MLD38_026360 [Melastoma candidum]